MGVAAAVGMVLHSHRTMALQKRVLQTESGSNGHYSLEEGCSFYKCQTARDNNQQAAPAAGVWTASQQRVKR